MSLYNEVDNIFKENNLKNKNGIAYYFEGIPIDKVERNEYINILVRNKNNFSDIIIDNAEVAPLILELKEMFKIKDMSQEPFIIKKCLEKLYLDNVEKEFKELVSEYKFYESNTLSFDSLINFCGRLTYSINKNLQNDSSIIYYGDITKGKLYYLRFMNKLGYNTIIINTKENNPKQVIPILEDYFKPIKFKDKILNFQIPDKEIISVIETNAYKAEQQVNEYYESDENKEINKIVNVPIRTSYEDLINLWLTPINERKGYKLQNGIKYIPNFVCKINGIENDEELFKNKIQQLITNDTIVFNGLFETDKFYGKSSVTNDLKDIMNILKKNVKEILKDKLKNFDKQLKDYVLSDKFIDIIQRCDKENYNPKLFAFHNDKIPFTKFSLEIYEFYQSFGFDIIMFSPSGYAGIEQLKECNLYELDKYNSKFKFKNERDSLFKRIFRR